MFDLVLYVALAIKETKTASWSLTPGTTVQQLTKDGRLVKTMSRIFSLWVGKLTYWVK